MENCRWLSFIIFPLSPIMVFYYNQILLIWSTILIYCIFTVTERFKDLTWASFVRMLFLHKLYGVVVYCNFLYSSIIFTIYYIIFIILFSIPIFLFFRIFFQHCFFLFLAFVLYNIHILCVKKILPMHGDVLKTLPWISQELGRCHPTPLCLAKSNDLVSLIFTSGTTGLPKAAMFTHCMFMRTTECAMKTLLVR